MKRDFRWGQVKKPKTEKERIRSFNLKVMKDIERVECTTNLTRRFF